jgi:iron complex outermembrane receptor protein
VLWATDKDRSWAVFSELTGDLTDRVALTGGLRYSWEQRTAYASFRATTDLTPPDPLPFLGTKTWSSTTPRVSLLFKATDDVNVYGTISKGFKSGTFNTTSLQAAPVNPEKITAFEAGVKAKIGPRLTLNAAAFRYNYDDLQVPTISQDPNGRLIQSLTNAATAKVYGAEVSGAWRASDAFNLTFGATYLHGRYDSFPSASDNVPTGVGGNTTVQINASGHTMVRSPTLSANLAGAYKWHTGSSELELSGSLYYASRVYFDVINRVNQPAYELINTALAWRPTSSGLEVRLWGKNLGDKAVISATTITAAYDSIDYAPPRTFGVEASYKF